MRKRITAPIARVPSGAGPSWLDVESQAEVELTSEDAAHPIESALRPGGGSGWRAAEPGEQTIRLRFDAPRRIGRVRLAFDERETPRTQEFVLRWAPGDGQSFREVVRQQYTFSPPNTVREVEEYAVNLDAVGVLELSIVPDVSGGASRASLSEWLLT